MGGGLDGSDAYFRGVEISKGGELVWTRDRDICWELGVMLRAKNGGVRGGGGGPAGAVLERRRVGENFGWCVGFVWWGRGLER